MDLMQGTQTQLWQTVIREGARRGGVRLDEDAESYLGFVLIRYLRDTQLASHTLALDWLQAHEERALARADALRDVGDRCLLIAGLFPQLATRRRVSEDYFIDLGGSAYRGVAEAARAGYAALFAQLARGFEQLVAALRHVRDDPAVPAMAVVPIVDRRRH